MKRESTKRADATKEIVLQRAIELFLKYGYKNTTMKDLAKVVGIKGPGIYYYFKSKKDILAQAAESDWNGFRKQVYDDVVATQDPEEAIKLYIRRMIKYQTEKRHRTFRTVNDLLAPITFQKKKKEHDKEVFMFLRRKLCELAGRKGKEHVDCTVAAFGLLSMVLNTYIWYNPKKKVTLKQLQEQTIRLFFSGFFG